MGGSLTLYAARAPKLEPGGLFAPVSREGGLLINNLFFNHGCSNSVYWATLYPLIAEAIGLGKLSVGAPYFNTVFIPLMVPLVLLMGIGPMMAWKRGDLPGVLGRLKGALAVVALAFGAALVLSGFLSR